MAKHDGTHDADCYGCRIRTVNIAPSAMPTRRNTVAPRGTVNNSWERAVVQDDRGMPMLDDKLNPIDVKEWHNRPSHYEGQLSKAKQGQALNEAS